MSQWSRLFDPYWINGLLLKNRITMAPLYVGYADTDGMVTPLVLEHYRGMAASGAALIVVENAAIHASGLGSPNTLRIDHDEYIPGMAQLASTIQNEGALAFLQINHAGRYAYTMERIAPSPIETGEVIPMEMTTEVIERSIELYAAAARRVREAGFDGVEIHGATGYLLVQFLSHRTNQRADEYGGDLKNRMRFPLRVVDAVLDAVGDAYPVGYRFLADEWLPDGLHLEETSIYAKELAKKGIAYLSVTAGTYDSFFLPDYLNEEKHEAYMARFAAAIKQAVPHTPVITAGRIQTPETANRLLEAGVADLVGLARVLFADPLWPKKAAGLVSKPIVRCEHSCSLCMKRTLLGRPAYCSRWDKKHRQEFLKKVKETEEESV